MAGTPGQKLYKAIDELLRNSPCTDLEKVGVLEFFKHIFITRTRETK